MNVMKSVACLVVALTYAPVQSWAAPILGAQLSDFAVLGASSVTNVGHTVLAGDLGVSNNTSLSGITGFFGTLANDGPGTASGVIAQSGAVALAADGQLATAMSSLGLLGPGTTLGTDLTGLTLAPGVYTVLSGQSNLTGALTLDGLGDANAFWVFQMPSTLITSFGSSVNLINTGAGAGVYWNVGSSATLAASSTFAGNIMAYSSITMNSDVALSCGRALAHTGAVTLISDTVNAGDCAATGAIGSHGLSGGLAMPDNGGMPVALPFSPVVSVPEPGPVSLYAAGLLALFMVRRKHAAPLLMAQ